MQVEKTTPPAALRGQELGEKGREAEIQQKAAQPAQEGSKGDPPGFG